MHPTNTRSAPPLPSTLDLPATRHSEARRSGGTRVILMLQGHPSRFWPNLADALAQDGHKVLHVNLCLADQIFWGRRPALNYRGRFSGWKEWLSNQIKRHAVTDILYYADRLPYHRVAMTTGRKLGVAIWTIEHGYLRPDWLTLEPVGMGAKSGFPRQRREIEAIAATTEPPNLTTLYSHKFATEAFHEVTYNLLQTFGRPFFPFYWSDKVYWPVVEYLNWLAELSLEPRRKRAGERLQARIVAGEFDYNLVAMQIQDDYQVRGSSSYTGLGEFLDEVFASFARTAPKNQKLIVKIHPLDNGLARWFSKTKQLAKKHDLTGRVFTIRGGDLKMLIRKSRGVVIVNSTVGIHALRETIPTYCAGTAVYDLPGLTHQGNMDSFWTAPESPESDYFSTFERALTRIQIKGSFYNIAGRKRAIDAICARFLDEEHLERSGLMSSPR